MIRRSIFVAFASAVGCQSAAINPSASSSSSRPPETSQAEPAATTASEAVGRKFEEWLAAVNSGDKSRLEAVWRGSKDAEMRAAADVALAEQSGGFELKRSEDATASEMLAVLRGRRSERWVCLRFRVDPDSPHAIETIFLRPTAELAAGAKNTAGAPLDGKARGQVLQALVRELHRAYVFPEKAEAMERELLTRTRQHAYEPIVSRLAFASALTEDMLRITRDKHLRVEVECSAGEGRPASEARKPAAPPVGADRPRVFGSMRRLDGNVAYLDIATFAVPVEAAREEVRDAMSRAADAAAIIFDVRNNGGGEPETVALVSSYLFGAEPVHLNSLYWRVPDRTDDFFTDPRVQGAKFGPTKPIYVLTSGRTFSAAEEFTYNLQTRKRATIVGETTGGGAHPGDVVHLPRGFSVFVPSGRAINPMTNTNWEGTGVKPDVAAPAATALEAAHKLALGQAGTPR